MSLTPLTIGDRTFNSRLIMGSGGATSMDPVSYTHLTLPTNREV